MKLLVQIHLLHEQPLVRQGVIDGISFWIEGTQQEEFYQNLTELVQTVRTELPLSFPIFTGGYLVHSRIGWLSQTSFWSLIQQSASLYDQNQIQGFYIFAGDTLSVSISMMQICVQKMLNLLDQL